MRHVGCGYIATIVIDPTTQHTYLFWMNDGVADTAKIYSPVFWGERPIPASVQMIVERSMRTIWGHTGLFDVSDEAITFEPFVE